MDRTRTDAPTADIQDTVARATLDTREVRSILGRVELRAKTDDAGGAGMLVGYAALFNQETVIGSYYGFREVIAPGAFTDAIASDDIRALFNHNPDIPLGRNTAKTLRLEEDATGLRYEIDLPDTSAARDLRTLIERGDVTGSSFAFSIEADEDDEWDHTPVKDGKLPVRTIRKVSLYDVSPVTYPAYEGTSVSARAKAKAHAGPATEARSDEATTVDTAIGRALVQRAQLRSRIEDAKAWPTA